MAIFWLAARNLILQRKRYTLVGIAVLAGFLLITVISGAAYGAMATVRAKAARYFAGHVTVRGYINGSNGLEDPSGVEEALRAYDPVIRTIARRTSYNRSDASLFFGGETVRQRKLMGVDFQTEYNELSNLAFAEGSIEAMLGDAGLDGILISQTAASIMACRVGDEVNLYLTTDSGQYNTATLVVRGVFRETSLFGYIAYMRNEDLNRLLSRAPAAATDLAVYLESGVDESGTAERMRQTLGERFNVYPRLPKRTDLDAAIAADPSGSHIAVLSLDAQLDLIKNILDAFLAVTYFVLVLFVLIVMVGILNTYRVIVYERTREIGTMRALGMRRGSVAFMFLAEACGLALVASAAGFVLGLVLFWLLGLINLASIPAAGLFTDRGRLAFILNPSTVLINLGIMTAGVVSAAMGPSRRAAAIRPADAMRSES